MSTQLAPAVDGSLDPALTCQYCKDTSHLKENCVKLTQWLALDKEQPGNIGVRQNATTDINQPPKMGNWNLLQLWTRLQEWIRVVLVNIYEEDLIWSVHTMSILAATKLEIMQYAVAKSP